MPHYYPFHGSTYDFDTSDSFDFTPVSPGSYTVIERSYDDGRGQQGNILIIQEDNDAASHDEPPLEGVTVYLDVNQNAADDGHDDWIDILQVSRSVHRDHNSVLERVEGLTLLDAPAADDCDCFTYTITDGLG